MGLFHIAFEAFFRFPHTTTVLMETAFGDQLVTEEAERQINTMSVAQLEEFLKDFGRVKSFELSN